MSKPCERCRATPKGEYELFDYCGTCGKDLCGACMAKGCCGKVPAASGMTADEEPFVVNPMRTEP